MAATAYGVNDAATVKVWGRKLLRESIAATRFYNLIGEGSDSVIQKFNDLSKGPGDRVTNILRVKGSGAGVSGDSTLEGNEESLTTYTDNTLIDQLRHAFRSAGQMSEQRVPFSMREEHRLALTDWFSERLDTAIANTLAGNTAQGDTKYTGSNATTAPTSNNRMFVYGTADESLSATNTITLTQIDNAVEKAKTNSPLIRPIKIGGEEWYTCYLHPYQVTNLRTATTTGQWLDIQKAAMQGGRVADNPIFTGALGVYNRTVLHEATRIPQGVNSSTSAAITTVRRALFLGAQSASICFGRNSASKESMRWVEKFFDYENQLGVAAALIWGIKKNVYNSQDLGVITISSYATAAT